MTFYDNTSIDVNRTDLSSSEIASLTPEQREQYQTKLRDQALTSAISGNDDSQRNQLMEYRHSLTDKFNSVYTQMHEMLGTYLDASSQRLTASYTKAKTNVAKESAFTNLTNYQTASNNFNKDGNVGDKIKLPSSVSDSSSTKNYLTSQVYTYTKEFKVADAENTQAETEYAQITKKKDTADGEFQRLHDKAEAVVDEQRVVNNMLNLLG